MGMKIIKTNAHCLFRAQRTCGSIQKDIYRLFGRIEKYVRLMVPSMILLITISPILAKYLFNLHLPTALLSDLEGIVLGHLLVLLIGLVLMAWNYNLGKMITYRPVVNLLSLISAPSLN